MNLSELKTTKQNKLSYLAYFSGRQAHRLDLAGLASQLPHCF
jgi:hypothetical protein